MSRAKSGPQRSTSVWLTLDQGTSRRLIPRSDAFELDVGQHQSNVVVGSQVKMSPAHCSPVSVSAYQKYLAPFDAPPRTVAVPPGGICHQPFLAQLSPSGQFGKWYERAKKMRAFPSFRTKIATSVLLGQAARRWERVVRGDISRRLFDNSWVVDLGGELGGPAVAVGGRGHFISDRHRSKSLNLCGIQTPKKLAG